MEFTDFLIWVITALITSAIFIFAAYKERRSKTWIRTLVFIVEFLASMLIAFLFMCVLPDTISVFVVLQPLIMADMLVTMLEVMTLLATTNAKRRTKFRIYKTIRKICPFVVAGLGLFIIVCGYFNMQNIVQKNYNESSNKLKNNYKIAFMSDIHYGKAQLNSVFEEGMDQISNQDVDMVLISGDIVDDYTTKEEMQKCVETLSKIKTKKGIYIVDGNHELQPSQFCKEQDKFTNDEFLETCKTYGLRPINDECIDINTDLQIVGREDSTSPKRIDNKIIEQKINHDKYSICIDHQPSNWDDTTDMDINLTLSGHYHGGQVWPLHFLSELIGNFTYGSYDYNNYRLIVTSGVAGWQYPIRTEGSCEYVIINLNPTN